MCTVGSSALLGGLVDLNVRDTEAVGLQSLGLMEQQQQQHAIVSVNSPIACVVIYGVAQVVVTECTADRRRIEICDYVCLLYNLPQRWKQHCARDRG
jgi:hypothetical protein